jgi:presenilin-like A22 family membrane protease
VVAPFSESLFGSFGNATYFVALVATGALLLYLLLRRKSLKIISIITSFALTAAIIMLSLIYLSAALSTVQLSYVDFLVIAISITVTAVADYLILKSKSRFGNWVILGLGGALGSFLGISIPTLSALLILCLLAVYDVFAVYHGPVGKIAKSGLEQLRGLSVSFKEIQMGLGDLTFYSMLSGHMLFNFGLVSCLASIFGILLGCLLSFRMLEKKGMFPGLPFPIVLGIAAGFLASIF